MKQYALSKEQLSAFRRWLYEEECSSGTVGKYLRDIRDFLLWLGRNPITKEAVSQWKEKLQRSGIVPGTVNSKLSALNKLFGYLGWRDCRVKYLKIQRSLFRSSERELSREEYARLVKSAKESQRERLALLMETICATGIRVSELRYITVEAVRQGRAEIRLKGKIRTILLPSKLCRKLEKYAGKQKTVSGEIFVTRNGKGIGRRQIWAEMKSLCKKAGVAASKVFPHNLRHLFARTYYRACRDVAKLADLLGHSSIETTRIYLISTGAEHARQLERLNLIC